jgi:ribonuclease HI
MLRVYTDGACLKNPGPGGWAYIAQDGRYNSGGEILTTNQRMELTAAIFAIKEIEGDLIIISDSAYLINCFKEGWWRSWERNGYLNSSKKPVKNADLWKELVNLAFKGKRSISFEKVAAHSGIDLNEKADALAKEKAYYYQKLAEKQF